MSNEIAEKALNLYEQRLRRLKEANADRDRGFIEEFMAEGFSKVAAENALIGAYYGGDVVNLDDPMWQDPKPA